MNAVVACAAVIGSAGLLYGTMLVLASRRGVCPGCGKRSLEMDGANSYLGSGRNERGERFAYSLSSYRCTECTTEWRSHNGGALVTREAYEAGATEPPPKAIVRSIRETP